MFRISDLRHKDIVNSIDGKRLGYIKDIELDLNEGRIKAIILPGENRLFSFFGRNDDIIVDWQQVKKIGVDVVLVELPGFAAPGLKENKRPKNYSESFEEDDFREIPESNYKRRRAYAKKAPKEHREAEKILSDDIYYPDYNKNSGQSRGTYEAENNNYFESKSEIPKEKIPLPGPLNKEREFNFEEENSRLWHSRPQQGQNSDNKNEQGNNQKSAEKSTVSSPAPQNFASAPIKWGGGNISPGENNILSKWEDKNFSKENSPDTDWDNSWESNWKNEEDWGLPPSDWPEYPLKPNKK